MELRAVLEGLEAGGGEHEVQLAFLAVRELGLDETEVRGARRRALLVLASGGDPRRELEPESRAVSVVAEALDGPGRAEALRAGLRRLAVQAEGLPAVSAALDRLLADDERAWRWAACALLAEELAG